jgi:hypothetical protein
MLAAMRSFFFNLHGLHRLGSFLNPLSAKNSCSPALKTNSSPQSMHLNSLSVYSCTWVTSLVRFALPGARTNQACLFVYMRRCVYRNYRRVRGRDHQILQSLQYYQARAAYHYCEIRVQPNEVPAIIALFRWLSSNLSRAYRLSGSAVDVIAARLDLIMPRFNY